MNKWDREKGRSQLMWHRIGHCKKFEFTPHPRKLLKFFSWLTTGFIHSRTFFVSVKEGINNAKEEIMTPG